MLPTHGNKESFRLLDSSDEESEDLQLEIIPSRKKKITRRDRSRGGTQKPAEPNIGSEVKCAIRWALRGTLVLWLFMLTWLCATLYDQVSVLKLQVDTVSVSNGGVNDALQLCHTMVKEVRGNTSSLALRLTALEYQHLDLSKRVEQAIGMLNAAPELSQKQLNQLQASVGQLGSQIKDFDGKINNAKKQATAAAAGVDEMKTLVHVLELRANETAANVSGNARRREELRLQVAALNTTLQETVGDLRTRIDKLHAPVPPPPPSTLPPASPAATPAAATTSTTSTTTPPPGPPAKPSVLE